MATGETINYVDSQGKKHRIEEYGRNRIVHHLGGSSTSFDIKGVLINGKKWAEYDNFGMGNSIEFAKQWIEEQIEARKT